MAKRVPDMNVLYLRNNADNGKRKRLLVKFSVN